MLTIAELQSQKRWVLWRLQNVKGKQTKVPYQPCGRHAMANNPATWHTYAECAQVAAQFSGIGLVLGDGVWGVDLDQCCDAVTGKFSPESREIVIGLDSYGEYSPSGTGAHVLGLGKLPGGGIKKPFPGCKAVEIKAEGFYFTFTGRHLSKTPSELMDRQAQITELYNRLSRSNGKGLVVTAPADEEEQFKKLMAGDASDYDNDLSRADFALFQILARRCHNDIFKMRDEALKSALCREKWERTDYLSRTILSAMKGNGLVTVFDSEPDVDDDGEIQFVLEGLDGNPYGLFPVGEVSVIGGASGVGKSTFLTPMLEDIRNGRPVLGHTTKARDYRTLLHDRSRRSVRKMAQRMGLSNAVLERLVRLTPEQQRQHPADIIDAVIEASPGIGVLAVEALDFWIPDLNKLDKASAALDALQRVAVRRNVAIIATVGTPKQTAKDKYQLHRDSLIGSSAIGRKVETVVLLEFHNPEDPNSVRRCTVLPRDSAAEVYYFEIRREGLVLTAKPEAVREDTALSRIADQVFAKFKPGEMVSYSPELGAEGTFYRWRKQAMKDGKLAYSNGCYFVPLAIHGHEPN